MTLSCWTAEKERDCFIQGRKERFNAGKTTPEKSDHWQLAVRSCGIHPGQGLGAASEGNGPLEQQRSHFRNMVYSALLGRFN